MKSLILIFFLCFFALQANAQRKCGSVEYYNQQMLKDPEFAKNQELLEQATKEYLKMESLKAGTVGPIYTIPVVVHVIYNSLTNSKYDSNIDDDQIQSMIDVLNSDFQLMNTDKDNIPDYFKDMRADIQIKFELAKRDPNGNCTKGITRDYREKKAFNDILGDAKRNSTGGVDAWDTKKYLNIWTVPGFTDMEIMGASTFPGETILQISGIVLQHNWVGTGLGSAIGLGRTATHEVGHYLNLQHIWGKTYPFDKTTCYDGDGVDDTPNQDGPNEGCPTSPHFSCTEEPHGDMFMNYMDYTSDECRIMFTKKQKSRIRAAMQDPSRITLVSSTNLALISPLADLTIINPTSVEAGNNVTVYFAEDNKGSSNAPPNYINFHLSSDPVLTPGLNGDQYLDQYFVEQGVTGHSQTIEYSKQIEIPKTVAPGVYYLFIAADGSGIVSECDDDNNFASVKLEVTGSNAANPPRNLSGIAGDGQVTLNWLAPSIGIPLSYTIYRGNNENGTFISISSNIKTTNKTITGLSNGTTYWFYVEAVWSSGERTASFKVNVTPAKSIKLLNDDCSSAILLNSSTSNIYLENQTVNNATASGKPKGSCDVYSGTPALADVWYYFKAQSTAHTITVDPNGSQLDAVIVAYNSCTSDIGINCSDVPGGPGTLSTLNLTGLVIGNYYYIRVYDYGLQTSLGDFRICVSGESSNNSCSIVSVTPSTITHGSGSFSTTPGSDDIYFNSQPLCSFEITNYCSWLTLTPMSGTTNSNGQAFLNYTIQANTSSIARHCTFYINGKPVIINQNGVETKDDDNDGVTNDLDLCPNTPIGEVVDANGCSDSQIFIEVSSLQYYDVPMNTSKSKIISFTNEGTTDFTITSLVLKGTNASQFSFAPGPPIVISPGTFQNLTVTFNPTSIGAKVANIEIATNTVKIPTKTITLKGNGVDHGTKVLVSNPATSYQFGDTKIAVSISKTFTIQNTGSNTFTITGVSLVGLNKDDFSITSQLTVPFDLSTGETNLIIVKFLPTSIGSKNAELSIANNSENLAPIHKIELYGNGVFDEFSGTNNVLIAYEYWFDNNFGSKVTVPAFFQSTAEFSASIPTTSLSSGLHNFNIRYLDNKKQWSSVISEVFYKLPITIEGSRKISEYEYWFDNDYAAKVTVPGGSEQIISLDTSINAIALPVGLHNYHTRFKDDAGQWSSVVSEVFYKLPVIADGLRKVTEYEYWFDNDYAAKVSVPGGSEQIISLDTSINAIALPVGLHNYHTRFKDDAGQWSSVISEVFYKMRANGSTPNLITEYRYWYDLDHANRISEKLAFPVNPYELIKNINTCSLQQGSHTIHFQFKDTLQAWSSVVTDTVMIAAIANPVISANGSTSFTEGDSVLLTSTPANFYLWSNGATTQSITVKTGGDYYVMVDNGCDNALKSNVITVTVKKSTVVVSKKLAAGWSWFSLNVENADMSIGQVLSSLVHTDGDYIKNQTVSSTYYPQYGWFGELTSIDPREMYKIKLSITDSLIYEGYQIDPQTRPISIKSGWTWIGYLPKSELTVAGGLNTINPVADDYIKNQTASSTYYDTYGWFGELVNLSPLDGYMLKTKNSGTLTYVSGVPLKTEDTKTLRLEDDKRVRAEGFEYSGQITATVYLNGRNFDGEDYCLFSVVEGQVHGVSRGMWFEPEHKWIHNHLTYSNVEEGDTIRFRLYDSRSNNWYEFKEFVVFKADMLIANALDPFILQNSSLLEPSALSLEPSLEVYPNPVNSMATVRVTIPTEQLVFIQIFDYLGRLIDELEFGRQKAGVHQVNWDTRILDNGVYFLRIKNSEAVYKQVVISR